MKNECPSHARQIFVARTTAADISRSFKRDKEAETE